RVQRGENDFERRLAGIFGMVVDRNAAAVIGDGDGAVLLKDDFDFVGVACDGLVHGVVENFGHEVVEGALVGAADIHAGALAHGFEAFEHFDAFGGVVVAAGGRVFFKDVG